MHPERALRTAQLVNRLAGVVTNFISFLVVLQLRGVARLRKRKGCFWGSSGSAGLRSIEGAREEAALGDLAGLLDRGNREEAALGEISR